MSNNKKWQKLIKIHQNSKSDKIKKIKKHQKSTKSENVKVKKVTKCKSRKVKTCQNSPSDPPHVDFGLRIGSRGTPRDWKNAGPGGSDFAKCRFWPFKWHFTLFWPPLIFWHFSSFSFYHFFCFCILAFYHFLCFMCFGDFSLFVIFGHYCHKALLCTKSDHFSYHRGGRNYVWWFLLSFIWRGDSQEGDYFILSFSPLSLIVVWVLIWIMFSDVGEIHRERL